MHLEEYEAEKYKRICLRDPPEHLGSEYMKRAAIIAAVIIASLLMATATLYLQWLEGREAQRLSSIRVAVYVGPRTWRDGLDALESYFKSRNISYSLVNSTVIKSGGLREYNVLVVPGGWAYSYYLDLGVSGGDAIREFVEDGGGYIGICAGGYYAAKTILWEAGIYHYSLKIIDAVAEGPKKGYPWPTYAYLQINMTGLGLEYGLNKTYTAVYYGGPEFEYLGRNVSVLAVYGDDGAPAIVLGEYGKGRVAAIGVHLEVREDTWPILDTILHLVAGNTGRH